MSGQHAVKFGTDGWRGVIADDFTFDNVREAAAAIAGYIHAREDPAKGVCVGYDTRFLSRHFAVAVAEVLAGSGIPVRLADRITPTPALSFAVRGHGAAGGVMITSSHNPAQWNGVKYKAWYGGAGKPSIIAEIESFLGQAAPRAERAAAITETDFHTPFVTAIAAFADLKKIAASGYRFLIDNMYGAGRGVLAEIFTRAGVPHVEIRADADPLFHGIHPEPIVPYVADAQRAVVEQGCHAGLITDGDADRIGAVDEHGSFIDPNKIMAVLASWMIERKGWPGAITRAFNTTGMLDRIAARHGRELFEHGIGFKHVVDIMLEREVLIGGEEAGGIGLSRHLPERDGLLNGLLIANAMADEQKTLGEIVASLQAEYGAHEFGRIGLRIDDPLKSEVVARAAAAKEIAGMKVLRVGTLDGVKLYLDNPAAKNVPNAAETWLMFRASGTEPLLRIYSESISKDEVTRLLDAGSEFALGKAV